MKKVIFLAIAAAAALTACSKSEVVDSTVMNQVIAFDNYVGKDAQTKAAIVTGDAITSVNVNAYLHPKNSTGGANFTSNFMTNQVVSKDGSYSPAKYWPAVDQAVDFVAWVPVADYTVSTGEGESATTETKNNITVENATLTFTVPADVKNQSDLLVANPVLDQNRAAENTAVNLVFKHLLSRIGFQINATGVPSADDNTTKVELVEVTLNGKFASQGTVNMTVIDEEDKENPTTKVVGTASEVAYTLTGENFGYTSNIIAQGSTANTADSYIMLIPDGNEPANITVKYTVTTLNGEGTDDDVVITNNSVFPLQTDGAEKFAYKAGKAYKYIFNITMEAISFKVEETPWADETEVDITPANPATPEPEEPAQGA